MTDTARYSDYRLTERGRMNLDALALQAELRERVEGEVRFDAGTRAAYAHDASNYRQVPFGVVLPKDADDVVETMNACRKHGAPVLMRGAGDVFTTAEVPPEAVMALLRDEGAG